MTAANTAATRFRKKHFCIVGTSPASRINKLIREKQNADNKIHTIPFLLFSTSLTSCLIYPVY